MTKKILLTICATLSVTCGAQSVRSNDSQWMAGESQVSGRLMAPEKVADSVWVMRQPDRLWASVIGNVTIVEQSEGIVVIDSGGSIPDGREIVKAVSQLTPKPIKVVAITHWHNDHPLGVPGILESWPEARVISTPATKEFVATETSTGVGKPDPHMDAARRARAEQTMLDFKTQATNPGNPAYLRENYAIEARWVAERIERQMGNYVVQPTETVSDFLLLDDPAVPVELRVFGTANTHGDLMAWLPRQKVMVAGDAVVRPTPYGFTVSTKPWLATLERMERLPFTILIPGHGQPLRDRTYLETLKWSMRDIASQANIAAASGIAKDDALAKFDRSKHRERFGATDPWTRRWLDAYWLDGMFRTAFDEANGIAPKGK
jgi:glyoxylase-like metal-dependent hydrolase (beta-lactamase superfamily II)